MQNKRIAVIALSVFLLLMVPLIGMQFTNAVDWKFFDFVVMGILLSLTGLSFELVMRKVKDFKHRLVLLAAILLAFLLIWAELAVGIFGTPFAGS